MFNSISRQVFQASSFASPFSVCPFTGYQEPALVCKTWILWFAPIQDTNPSLDSTVFEELGQSSSSEQVFQPAQLRIFSSSVFPKWWDNLRKRWLIPQIFWPPLKTTSKKYLRKIQNTWQEKKNMVHFYSKSIPHCFEMLLWYFFLFKIVQ